MNKELLTQKGKIPTEMDKKIEATKAKRKAKEKRLDKTVEDTFPASDATAKY
ncbi:hypothetical protein [Legionella clemsonensis]|uniref:Uncharacterized protein n=1 Tax=Legionella clemsonensis TaxID=1867846 RepID=A0A222NYW1_9GAMM|nr:hypothetical protein [Legionella clemsonensis]ASQ44783.1 hypothetical protein clem_01085 [Legionella clemsonensis]